MLKSRTGTERSDHRTTCAMTAVAFELLTENVVLTPFGRFRSTSKYGRRRVAAGTSSTVQVVAPAAPARARADSRTSAETCFLTGTPPSRTVGPLYAIVPNQP